MPEIVYTAVPIGDRVALVRVEQHQRVLSEFDLPGARRLRADLDTAIRSAEATSAGSRRDQVKD